MITILSILGVLGFQLLGANLTVLEGLGLIIVGSLTDIRMLLVEIKYKK